MDDHDSHEEFHRDTALEIHEIGYPTAIFKYENIKT